MRALKKDNLFISESSVNSFKTDLEELVASRDVPSLRRVNVSINKMLTGAVLITRIQRHSTCISVLIYPFYIAGLLLRSYVGIKRELVGFRPATILVGC